MFTDLDYVYVIAECGINANGDVNIAKQMIKAAKDAGANCAKFQKRTINLVYSAEELASFRDSKWGSTFREQKEGLEFSKEDYRTMQSYSTDIGIDFTASPWDASSVRFLDDMDVPFIKIPSAKATDKDYLDAVVETHLPIILSTGMCDENIINKIVWYLQDKRADLQVIMSCTSTYPTSEHEIDLNRIKRLISNFSRNNYAIGWSGHDTNPLTGALAVACGAEVVERHLTLDRAMEGTDQKASLEPNEFKQMVKDIRFTETSFGQFRHKGLRL
jgi:N-acetylneuraminate synthase